MPGSAAADIVAPDSVKMPPPLMLMRREPQCLHMLLQDSSHWLNIRVHHFTRALFDRGRRFVADAKPVETIALDDMNWQEIRLKGITRSSGLLRLTFAEQANPFGECAAVWLRPVILDGEERYLLYRDKVTGQ
jgi:hypothetical protein